MGLLSGCAAPITRMPDLSQWVEIILSQQWEKAFVFFKHEGDANGAEMAMRFQELIDSRLGTKNIKIGRTIRAR